METEIHLLDSAVVDQIAAGEVVERPAHLVKELVENAIDAGAQTVEVEFDFGGRHVRVTDDGGGITGEQLPLALARHATSKISQASDLWSLSSFGFRGEALASIAAVSRLSLISRKRGSTSAHGINSEFGRFSSVEVCAGNFGTSVVIDDLFANTPARLKFMKSETAESTQIKTALRALALSHENVEFRIKSKGRVESLWPRAASFALRARTVLGGVELYEACSEYKPDDSDEVYRAHVVFAGPNDVTGNSRSIMTFVQNRWVQDRGLQAAVNDAFRGLLMHGESPIAVVKLEVPRDAVDVNIHPTKSQVKFRDAQAAFRAVNRTLRTVIETAPWLKRSSYQPAGGVEASPALHAMAKAAAASASEAPKRLNVSDLTRPYSSEVDSSVAQKEPQTVSAQLVESGLRFDGDEFDAIVLKRRNDQVSSPASAVAEPTAAIGAWSRLHVIGQAALTYIVAQDAGQMVLIDQHAAHERVVYERLMKSWKAGEIPVQPLLLPFTIELESDGAEALLKISSELESIGVSIDATGPRTIAVRSKPTLITDTALSRALVSLAAELVEKGGSFVLEKKISDIFATMSCHSVVRAGQALSQEQMKKLLSQMDEFALSSFCPHGRPVSVEIAFTKIERDFGRIV